MAGKDTPIDVPQAPAAPAGALVVPVDLKAIGGTCPQAPAVSATTDHKALAAEAAVPQAPAH